MTKDIMVSIICNTFNHEKYIEAAIKGFLMQETNFRFEVLIHDDASTDNTANIIRKYEALYPDIIKPVYQTENKYSKGISISKEFQLPRAKGKYIAICEGDDYWTHPKKLQKQFDIMESHPEVDICAHAAEVEKDGKITGLIKPSENACLFSTEQVLLGGGGFVPTASLFYRTELKDNPPKFREMYRMDYTLQIQGSLRGGMLYLSDCMSVYRIMTENSWSKGMSENMDKYLAHIRKIMSLLQQINIDTSYAYKDTINERLTERKNYLLYFMYLNNLRPSAEDEWFKTIPVFNKIYLKTKSKISKILKLLKNIIKGTKNGKQIN